MRAVRHTRLPMTAAVLNGVNLQRSHKWTTVAWEGNNHMEGQWCELAMVAWKGCGVIQQQSH